MISPGQFIIDFFKETFNRLGSKSPRFFRILQVLGVSLAFAGYVPSILQVWFGVTVPGHVISLCEDISKYATGFFASSMLAVKSNIVGQTTAGSVVKVTDENKMPFSAKAEEKEVAKLIPPPPVIEEVKDN